MFEGDRVVRLGSKAIEILIALVEHAGELVGKNQLVELATGLIRMWWMRTSRFKSPHCAARWARTRPPTSTSSTVQAAAIASSRRYAFWTRSSRPGTIRQHGEAHNLPAQIVRLVGRNDVLEAMKDKLAEGRLISVVGPPGVGKTSVRASACGIAAAAIQARRLAGRPRIDHQPIIDTQRADVGAANRIPIERRAFGTGRGVALQEHAPGLRQLRASRSMARRRPSPSCCARPPGSRC